MKNFRFQALCSVVLEGDGICVRKRPASPKVSLGRGGPGVRSARYFQFSRMDRILNSTRWLRFLPSGVRLVSMGWVLP